MGKLVRPERDRKRTHASYASEAPCCSQYYSGMLAPESLAWGWTEYVAQAYAEELCSR